MLDQRITVPRKGMVFGNNTEQLIDAATATMPQEFLASYQPALVISAPCGTKDRLMPTWSIGKAHVDFGKRHYGKVTFTLTAKARYNQTMESGFQASLFDELEA